MCSICFSMLLRGRRRGYMIWLKRLHTRNSPVGYDTNETFSCAEWPSKKRAAAKSDSPLKPPAPQRMPSLKSDTFHHHSLYACYPH